MPIDITANYIRIRVASPKKFTRFRVKTLGKGIKAVIGFLAGGGSQIQSVLFPKSQFTLTQAKAWVKSHGYHVAETFLVYDIDVGVDYIDFVEQKVEENDVSKLVEETLPKKNPEKRNSWDWVVEY